MRPHIADKTGYGCLRGAVLILAPASAWETPGIALVAK
jgi:hypothetical protein